MKKLLYIVFLSSVLVPAVLSGSPGDGPKGMLIQLEDSFLEPLQPRDSALIGDQFKYGFHLKNVAEGTPFALPDFSKGFMDSVEIVSPWLADTVAVHGRGKEPKSYDIDAYVVITSFEEGLYQLRPLALVRGSSAGRVDTLVFSPRELQVFTIPVDTTTFQVHDIKGQVRYPVTLAEILPYIAAVWLLALVAILAWAVAGSLKKKEKGTVRNDPPHIVALRRLERYRGSRYWAPEKQKEFYSGITDAVREYIKARYGIGAPEMTSAEMLDQLKRTDVPADCFVEMETLFTTADFVKFAKASASDEENAAALPAAVRFVTTTYQSMLEEEGSGGADADKDGGTE